MIKKFKNEYVQFDNANEIFNYMINAYANNISLNNYFDIDFVKLQIDVYKCIHDNFDENKILHIIMYDDCFDVYCKNNNLYEYYIDDEYNIHFDCVANYNSYNDYLQLNELQYIYDDVLCMNINETKIFNCKCDNALCIVNDIQFEILHDCVYKMNNKIYEMIIKHNDNYYVVHDDFNECECVNNYATKIKLTRIQ